ncbi:signal peptidase I [Nonomuraea thailandensis]|uniref:Signal peptidase I n=1 Tax=Nonomuraea thailandensis TaxID=1188745 RepID=A0A9X2G857_9ACTN|nr:signal peptidase I [Nonomuraea thailandensis]MCP2354287.1 signal peptidase I [Nonomuraea thailandensis]
MIRTRLRALSLALLLIPASGCGLLGYTVTISSESMEPTIKKGTSVQTRRVGDYAPRRGDIIVYRTPEGWNGTTAGTARVGRVIGTPGGTVKCCDAAGRLEVDGKALDEPYVASPPASHRPFEVRLPQGRLWIMNDNRHVALDSRAYQDAPGGGTVGVSDVTAVVSRG